MSVSTEYRDLSVRLAVLEQQNRRLRSGGILILSVLLGLFTVAQVRAGRTLEASKFLLVDGKGKPRGEFGLFLDNPSLSFLDDKGGTLLRLGFDRGEGALLIRDSASNRQVILGASDGPSLKFNDETGQRRLWLGFSGGSPALGLLAGNGEARAALGLAESSDPYLQLFGETERGGIQLTVAPDLTALRFLDGADKTRAVLGLLEKEKTPGLALNDGSGVPRLIMMLTAGGPTLDIIGENKDRLWHAP